MKRLGALLLVAATGCATTRMVGEPPFVPADPGFARTVVLEPFFEEAGWQTTTTTENNPLSTPSSSLGFGSTALFNRDLTVTRVSQDKPLYARVPALATEHRLALEVVRRLRPSWTVLSTSAVVGRTGPVSVVRVVVGDHQKVESNRSLKTMAFTFGLIILPLQLFQLMPVEETDRVVGQVQRFSLDDAAVGPRLLKYPTQPDFAVNLSGLEPLTRQFGLDLPYEEGLFANEAEHDAALIEGFAQKLAAAIIAVVEEGP